MCELDAAFEALADGRRRTAIACLQEHRELTLADLAELIAECERGRCVQAIDDEAVRDIYLSLYHDHVPKLEAADVAQYAQERDCVATTDRTETVLSAARENVATLAGPEC
ncbi:MAG: hypothetical protein ABEJ89_08120 [Haloarculaceae archaeon]